MAKHSVVITLTPGTPIQPAPTAEMSRNIFIQPRHGSTGILYVGGASLDKTTGTDLYGEVSPPPAGQAAGGYQESSYESANVIDPKSYKIDGDQADKILFTWTTE